MLSKLLFKIAKKPFVGKMVGNIFQYCCWAVPVKKVYVSKDVIVFHHPQPSYENHMIISPKRAIKNLQQMAFDCYSEYFMKIWETARDICEMHPEYNDSFVMVGNGGKRQEVQQVHFHMFTNHEIVNEYSAQEQTEDVFYRDGDICVVEHPSPNWEIHFVVKPIASSTVSGNDKYMYFRSALHSIDLLNSEFNIVQRGYSLVYQYNRQRSDTECPVFHIVSGKKYNQSAGCVR